MQVKGASAQLLKILSNGEWHSIGELIAVLAPLWPPERVIRRAKNTLRARWLTLLEEDPQRVINIGRRHLLQDMLWSLGRHHFVEKKKEGQRIVAVRKLVEPVANPDCELAAQQQERLTVPARAVELAAVLKSRREDVK